MNNNIKKKNQCGMKINVYETHHAVAQSYDLTYSHFGTNQDNRFQIAIL